MSEEAEFKFHLGGDNSDPKVYGVYKKMTATGTEWRVVGPLAKAIHAMLAEAIRERDEARKLADYYASGFTEEAEARGYRRGVEDAVVRCDMEMHNGPFPFDVSKTYAHQWTAKAIRAAISELLERNGDSNRPHPKSGAGSSAETE